MKWRWWPRRELPAPAPAPVVERSVVGWCGACDGPLLGIAGGDAICPCGETRIPAAFKHGA